jgi:hypothetical protein
LQLLEWENPVGGYGGSDTLLGPEETDLESRPSRFSGVALMPPRVCVVVVVSWAGSSFCHIASAHLLLGWVVGLVAGLWWLLFVV